MVGGDFLQFMIDNSGLSETMSEMCSFARFHDTADIMMNEAKNQIVRPTGLHTLAVF